MKTSDTLGKGICTSTCPTRAVFLIATMLAALPLSVFGQHVVVVSDSAAEDTWNNAIFQQREAFIGGFGSSGTGIFDPFVRSKGGDTLDVVNTDIDGGNDPQYETEGNAQWTTALLLSTVTQAMIGGVLYREFFLDINQVKDDSVEYLEKIEIWTDDQKSLSCYVKNPASPGTGYWDTTPGCATGDEDTSPFADLGWELDNPSDAKVQLLYDLAPGSGKMDLRLLIPDDSLQLAPGSTNCDYGQPLSNCSTYVYLYSQYQPNDDGFEEWSTAIQPFISVSKTVEGSLRDSVEWDITKSVAPDSLDLFAGDSADVKYTVSLSKLDTLLDITVSGIIALKVPDELPDGEANQANAQVDSLIDIFDSEQATIISCSGDATTVPPFLLAPGDSVTCLYSLVLDEPALLPADNVVTAWILNRENEPQPFDASATLSSFDTTAVGEPDTVNVSDLLDGGGLKQFGSFDDDSTFSYVRGFKCDADEGLRQNLAYIEETTGDSAYASVDVDCWDLAVRKTSNTSKKRYYSWTLDKYVDPDSLNLFHGDSADTKFTFDVERTWVDSGFVASGDITVLNNSPIAALVNSVIDSLTSPWSELATVDCNGAGTGPFPITAGDSLNCTYTVDVDEGGTGTNIATATQQNYNYDTLGVATAAGTTPYADTVSVVFNGGTTVTHIDSSATLMDSTYAGVVKGLGTLPNETDCDPEVGNSRECSVMFESTFACDAEGDNKDVAYLTTDSTGTVLTDTATVNVECYEITVAKTDTMHYTVEHVWDIDKSVNPDSIEIFYGDTHDVEWTVAIDDSSYTTDWRLFGKITLTNPNPLRDADLFGSVTDTLDEYGEIAPVDCGGATSVPADSTLMCFYDTGQIDTTANPFGSPNTATAYRQNYNYDTNDNKTPTGTTRRDGSSVVDSTDAFVTDTTSSVDVTDDNPDSSGPWEAFGDTSWTYSGEYACAADSGDHRNIAEIVQTGLKDTADVHVDCYQLAVAKDAQTTLTQNYEWTIDKVVDPDSAWKIFEGDSAYSKFTIDVTKSEKDSSNFKVDGNIYVINLTPLNAVLVDSVDDYIQPGGIWGGPVSCGETFPYTLVAGDSLKCTYMADLPDDSARSNIGRAWQQNYDYDKDGVGVADGKTVYADTADFDFSDPIVVIGADSSATAIDDLATAGTSDDSTWAFGDDGTVMYEKGFDCDDEGTMTNWVRLYGDDTGLPLDSASATVEIICYELQVTKDANTSWKKGWEWDIWKTNVQDTLILMAGQTYVDTAYYEIKVKGMSTDSAFTVQGTIVVDNPNPIEAKITGVVDTIKAGDYDGLIDCNPPVGSYPYVIPPDSSLTCSYGPVALPDTTGRVNEATAGLQNQRFHHTDATANLPDTTYWDGMADVIFAEEPTEEYDECVDVTDQFPGDAIPDTLGTFCATSNPDSTTFNDSLTVVVPLDYTCDTDSTIINTAKFITNDNGTIEQDTSDVVLTVPCPPGGCTLTLGYWKTHNRSFKGGAPPDTGWYAIGDWDDDTDSEGEQEDFQDCGAETQTWFEVFWTPVEGNPYYSLAHQYMAAVLNVANGASAIPDSVQQALDDAYDIFFHPSMSYCPEDFFYIWEHPHDDSKNKERKKRNLQELANAAMSILANFNEGEAGLPHCDEDNSSSLTLQGAPTAAAKAGDEAEALAKGDASEEIPKVFAISNYPNPFNPTTTLLIELPEDQVVDIIVYDALGRQVTRLMNSELKAGYHRVTWDAGNLSSGLYFYVLKSELYQRTKKMMLLK